MNFKSPAKKCKVNTKSPTKDTFVSAEVILECIRSINSPEKLHQKARMLWVMLGRFLDNNQQPLLAKSLSYADMLKEQTVAIINTIDRKGKQKIKKEVCMDQLNASKCKRNSLPKLLELEPALKQQASPPPTLTNSLSTQAFRFISYSYDNALSKHKPRKPFYGRKKIIPNIIQTEKQRLEGELKRLNDKIQEQRLKALEKCYEKMSQHNNKKFEQTSLRPEDSRILKEWNLNDTMEPARMKSWASSDQNWKINRTREASYKSCFFSKNHENTPDFSFHADSHCQSEVNNQNMQPTPTSIRKITRNDHRPKPKNVNMAKKVIKRGSHDEHLRIEAAERK